MASIPSSLAKAEYVVLNWEVKHNKLWRTDALSRTLSAALCKGRSLHVSCERGVISLSPEFLKEWQQEAAGAGKRPVRSQQRLDKLLQAVFAGAPVKGATFHRLDIGNNTFKSIMEALIIHRFERCLFLDLNDESCALRFDGESLAAEAPVERLLFVLGGVQDASEEEKATIKEVCLDSKVNVHTVSLGQRQLLTSQVIKNLEAADDTGLLRKGLSHCHENNWAPDRGLRCDPYYPSHPPLHIIKVLNETKSSFIERLGPGDAALLTDTFLISFGRAYAKLSFVCVDATMSLFKPEGKFLQEADALESLRQAFSSDAIPIKCGEPSATAGARIEHGLRRVLLAGTKSGDLGSHLILHADLNPRLAEPLPLPYHPAHVRNPVAVIISPQKFAVNIAEVGKDAMKLQRRFVGGALEVPAFTAMLFNDGFLGKMLLSSEQLAPPKAAATSEACTNMGGNALVLSNNGIAGNSTVPQDHYTLPIKAAPEKWEVGSEAETDITSTDAETDITVTDYKPKKVQPAHQA